MTIILDSHITLPQKNGINPEFKCIPAAVPVADPALRARAVRAVVRVPQVDLLHVPAAQHLHPLPVL